MLLYTNNQANQNKRHITYHAHSISQTFTAYNPYKIIINLSFLIINTPLNHLLSTRSKKVVRLKKCFLFKVFFKLLAFWGCILLVVFQSNNVQQDCSCLIKAVITIKVILEPKEKGQYILYIL